MDGIERIGGIVDATSRIAAVRPVGPAARNAPKPREAETAAVPAPQPAPREDDPFSKISQALGELFAERALSSKLRIDRNEDAGRFVYQAVDIESGEVLMQFPAEEMLRILSFYRQAAGLVVDDRV